MDQQTAEQWASQHGVTLQPQPDNNSQQPPGTITGQEPAAGSLVQQGQTVVVKVSSGPQLVAVPNPIGLSVEQATQELQGAGFQVQVNRYGPFNKVFDFSPVSEAPRGQHDRPGRRLLSARLLTACATDAVMRAQFWFWFGYRPGFGTVACQALP